MNVGTAKERECSHNQLLPFKPSFPPTPECPGKVLQCMICQCWLTLTIIDGTQVLVVEPPLTYIVEPNALVSRRRHEVQMIHIITLSHPMEI